MEKETQPQESMITLRTADLAQDAEQIMRIDTAFTTETIYIVSLEGDPVGLRLLNLPSPVTKRLPLHRHDLLRTDIPWEFAIVATVDGTVRGFLAASYRSWNRRLTVGHLYVDSSHRRQGIARQLTDRAQLYGTTMGALHLWLETSNLNTPAIAAYRLLGFELCGFDSILYSGTPASGETALFFARPIPPSSSSKP
jgi:ribosomal protein S18 acetylase RimI-like enzyme